MQGSKLSYKKFAKGHKIIKICIELRLLFFAHYVMMLTISTRCHENIKCLKVMKPTHISSENLQRGIKFHKKMKIEILFCAHRLMRFNVCQVS